MFDVDSGSFNRLSQVSCGCHSPAAARISALYAIHEVRDQPGAVAGTAAHPASGGTKPVGSPDAVLHANSGSKAAAASDLVAFVNVRIFDGKSDGLLTGMRVMVQGRLITGIEPQSLPLPEGCMVIDGKDGVLMPGLIDAHWHSILARPSMLMAMTADFNYVHTLAVVEAEATLMRGFTTVRDMGGPAFGLKRAVDEGLTPGPRIYPSGAFLSQTSGHGDFRMLSDLPRSSEGGLSYAERVGVTAIVDGTDQVLMRAREQLMRGASQLKYMAGGGVMSSYDGLDVTEGSIEELKAAVTAAENWGTYVTVHAYTSRAVGMALDAGVRCVEHGQLIDEDTARRIADMGAWWSLQPFLDDEDAVPTQSPLQRQKQLAMIAGTDKAYEMAQRFGIKTAWGTDTLFDARLATRQGAQLAKMSRWYGAAQVLRMATSVNGELCALAGPRNPYPAKLGVVEKGAWADLLLVDGNPLEDLQLLSRPEQSFRVIMKDGRICKHM
ncbi:amidohydrolase family protein [Achromobacter sp. Root565]|uniref:metal-dependent hydrolase family protein n=1 Tax=Achromobacter sp. Root565 TaxID=1736564 RepID=UPI0006F8C4B6|nr:amidohydrolase family protein [Achromobacter sp. Root565]KRA01260.1 hydrolase [Achromobacter sp. Root565]